MQGDWKKFTFSTNQADDFCILCIGDRRMCILLYEVRNMKEEEKQPLNWEAVDPKPPVIRSGHLENRIRNEVQ